MLDKRFGRIPKPDNGKTISTYPVADWLYGHRLILGQHWLEYTLEFLNVLAGFDYNLGKGIDMQTGIDKAYNPQGENYKVFGRYGLRRFVFFDLANVQDNDPDYEAFNRISILLKENKIKLVGSQNSEQALESVRSIFRSFTAVEQGRSWYARSLFPAHTNFLFFEARRIKSSLSKFREVEGINKLNEEDLDKGLRTSDRNFYARGGEIYYLMLSAATKGDALCKQRISNRLREIMNREVSLGSLADLVDKCWQSSSIQRDGELGWIPLDDCPSYFLATEDIDCFLQSKIDQQHTIELLAHLVGFHLVQMMYYRANAISKNDFTVAPDTISNNALRPRLPIDCIGNLSSRRAIRDISSALLKAQGDNQLEAARKYIETKVWEWTDKAFPDLTTINNNILLEMLLEKLKKEALNHFNLDALKGTQRKDFDNQFNELLSGAYSPQNAVERFVEALTTPLIERFRKSALGVHSKIGKGIGLIAPKQGRNARYILDSSLLKALVVANVTPGDTGVEFSRFVQRLYERYGLVIGSVQAKQAGLFNFRDIDRQFYRENEQVFRQKLRNIGLLREFSDATAIVINPFELYTEMSTPQIIAVG